MKQLIVAGLVILAPLTGHALESSDLLDHCRTNRDSSKGWEHTAKYVGCRAYILGFMDGHIVGTYNQKSTICFQSGVNPDQIAAIYVKWMETNPARWHEPTALTMESALEDAFPCRR